MPARVLIGPSAPLRVAIFGESYLPYLSGVTVSTETLARGLGALGHSVLLVVPRPARGVARGRPAAGSGPGDLLAPIGPSRRPRRLATGPRSRPCHERSVGARSFSRTWCTRTRRSPSGLMACRGQRAGAPLLVFTHHTRFAEYGHYLGPLAPSLGRAADAWPAAWWAGCAAIVAPSEALADDSRGPRPTSGPPGSEHSTGVDVAAIAPARGSPSPTCRVEPRTSSSASAAVCPRSR